MITGGNKALFLDRDGVINVEHNYVHRPEDFHFQQGIFELCAAAQDLGYRLIVVTNQAGIARGYYTESQYHELTKWMIERFRERNVQIAHVYYCPYHPVHGIGEYRLDSPDRKPKPGMLLRAQADYGLDLASSVMIGDQVSDIQAAAAAGVGYRILLRPVRAGTEELEETCEVFESLDDIRASFFHQSLPITK
jgi:D-glycero-D-manno-heptose 1,7-bisphosphate phosphatase